MSAIKDALSKVQQQRKTPVSPKTGHAAKGSALGRAGEPRRRTPLYVWIFANIAVLVGAWACYQLFLRRPPQNQRPAVVSHAPVVTAPAPSTHFRPSITSAPEIAQVTPAPEMRATFTARATPTLGAIPSDVEYDLSGTTAVGSDTLLSITRRSDRTSFWIKVGKTVGEVTAMSYNPETNDAVIRVRGQLVTIRRR